MVWVGLTPKNRRLDTGNMKWIYVFIYFLLVSCSRLDYNENATKILKFDGYNKYSTFDEWLMQGVGDSISGAFVYVKQVNDTIFVYKSTDTSVLYRYEKKDGYWHSHSGYDLWRIGDVPTKLSECQTTRIYDRFIFKDSIVEFRCDYAFNDEGIGKLSCFGLYKSITMRGQENITDVTFGEENQYYSVSDAMAKMDYAYAEDRFKKCHKKWKTTICITKKDSVFEFFWPSKWHGEYGKLKATKYGLFGIVPRLEKLDTDIVSNK